MKYLIVGLGNIGNQYADTRHNVGFMVVDRLAVDGQTKFETDRYASVARMKFKGRTLVMIKPTTLMNLSGKAVKYWMNAENIPVENILVIVDDIALDTGVLRMKKSGSDGGHNGLIDIILNLNSSQFPRLRFGIGKNFARGFQADYVLGKFTKDEQKIIDPKIDTACEMVKSFAAIGIDQTMNMFNNK